MLPTRPLAVLALFAVAALAGCGGSEKTTDSPSSLDDLSIRNLRRPMDGVLTAGQLTEEQFRALVARGFKDFVNLRPATEKGTGFEEKLALDLGVRFTRIPVRGLPGLNESNARKLATVISESQGDTFVYCGSSNRVGALFACKARWLDDKPVEEAMSIGRQCGLSSMRDATEKLLSGK